MCRVLTGRSARLVAISVGLALWATWVAAQPGTLSNLQTRAEQGNAKAQLRLGSMYAAGVGVDQNQVTAMKWFRRSAEQGYAPSFLPLAQAFFAGQEAPDDFVSAHLWFNIAAARLSGNDRIVAVEGRDQVQAKMSEELRQEYLLGYTPQNSVRDGSLRQITVQVPGRSYELRARSGCRLSP